VVVVRHLLTGRYALLFSTEVTLSAKTIYRYYKARFQIELGSSPSLRPALSLATRG
jgi:hypothetical protein